MARMQAGAAAGGCSGSCSPCPRGATCHSETEGDLPQQQQQQEPTAGCGGQSEWRRPGDLRQLLDAVAGVEPKHLRLMAGETPGKHI